MEFVPERPEDRDSLWVKLGLPFVTELFKHASKLDRISKALPLEPMVLKEVIALHI